MSTKTIVLGALLTAIVIVLQLMGTFVKVGFFAICPVLIPIVIGAATCGVGVGAWLGFVFGVVVLLSGDAAAFLTVNALGTVITVLLKGTACGLVAGLIYKALEKHGIYLAALAAAIACPIVNTGVFLIGCVVFFFETIESWGLAEGFGSAYEYMFLGLAGGNFIFELVTNILLSPVVVRLLNIKKKM